MLQSNKTGKEDFMRKPDYTQILKVLHKQVPERPTLFEFFLNGPLHEVLVNNEIPMKNDGFDWTRRTIHAFKNAGYDYVTSQSTGFYFRANQKSHIATISLNDSATITNWETFEKYEWVEPEDFDLSHLDKVAEELPEGMKVMVMGPSGVLENTINLVGYDNLCLMLYDEPELAKQIFDGVGSRLLKYYKQAVTHHAVCALISNDDWGFKTQPMLSPADMRKYVFPWHKKIAAAGHAHNKPVILHSCGQLEEVMEDVIEDMKFDAKHSFEDTIMPIEEAYEKYKGRIALLGGIDVGFVCTAAPEEISARSAAMLKRAEKDGGYALGTGNSVPEYVPHKNYFAMVDVVRKGLI
jgi:uroporphyrinogen decarboxylase